MAGQEFLAAYLIVGADEFKRKFVLERLEKRISALGDLDFNREVFMGAAAESDALLAACNTLPFACEYRLVIVKDADKLPKLASEALVEYLAAPCPTTILALDAAKLAKNTRLRKAVTKIGSKAVIECEPKKRYELPAQVRDFAVARGITITQQAADLLVDMVGESTVRLDAELGKMASALGRGALIDVPQVERYVTRSAEAKPWLFTDALAARDAQRCLILRAQMPSQSAFGLLARSVTLIRELIIAKELRGQPAGVLAAELGKQSWQVKNHMRWASGFSMCELTAALRSAADAERQMKTGADAEMVLEQWVLRVCTRAHA